MVPGSHLWGDQHTLLASVPDLAALPSEFAGHAVTVRRCPVPRGVVHYHHALVWHGSLANTSGRPRRAIALHYMTQETRYVAAGEHVMKPFVTVADGAMLHGASFPLVWERARRGASAEEG
jgi:ectoine hydroxylase-related dioxygenase (phytanoyl-CoA dioxygenase family)